MSQPNPPVGGTFRPDGLLLVVVEKGSVTQRLLSWDELYRLAKQGKKETVKGAMKTFTSKVDEVVKSNGDVLNGLEKRRNESAELLKEFQGVRSCRLWRRPPRVR